MRQNDWALGAYCAYYCRFVTGHHMLEDEAVFPHLRAPEAGLEPVIDRLADEHKIIHQVLNDVDQALVDHLRNPADFTGLQQAVDILTDALLSHLAYEEAQLVEPLARHGFYNGQALTVPGPRARDVQAAGWRWWPRPAPALAPVACSAMDLGPARRARAHHRRQPRHRLRHRRRARRGGRQSGWSPAARTAWPRPPGGWPGTGARRHRGRRCHRHAPRWTAPSRTSPPRSAAWTTWSPTSSGTVGGNLTSSGPGDFTATFALNAGHAAELIRAALPHLRLLGGGAVVIISSITGMRPAPRTTYAVAKAAEIQLAATAAAELAADKHPGERGEPGLHPLPGRFVGAGSRRRTRRTSPPSWAPSSRSGGWGAWRRSPTSSPSCCPGGHRGSPVPTSSWTAARATRARRRAAGQKARRASGSRKPAAGPVAGLRDAGTGRGADRQPARPADPPGPLEI